MDQASGISAAGSILGVLRSTAQRHTLLREGEAIVRSVVSHQGLATLELAHANGDTQEWTRILADASRQLGKLDSPNLRGTELLIRIRIRIRLPSGASPKSLGNRLGTAGQIALSILGAADAADIGATATRGVDVSVLQTKVI